MKESAVKILHIEDYARGVFPIEAALQQDTGARQYEVVHVGNLPDALQAMHQRGYDAVLLDLQQGDTAGLENMKRIQEQNPDVPLVVLSGWEDDEVALEAIGNGAQEYLVKSHSDPKVIQLAIQSSIKRKAIERQLFKQANYDGLTGLANRRQFHDYVERALHRASRWSSHKAILFVDLDGFKAINDAHGHEAGDEVLKEAAIRMTQTLRKSDIVARYGGDEFVVLLDDHKLEHRMVGTSVATKLLRALNAPVSYNGSDIPIKASIGIAVYPSCGEGYESLIRAADKAMYDAKQLGGNRFCFAESLQIR